MRPLIALATGELREVVTIEYKAITKDSYGADSIAWTRRATVRAAVEQSVFRPAEEFYSGLRVQVARNPTVITIRYRRDVSVADRVVWGTRVFNVEATHDPEINRRRWLCLTCAEVQQ